MKSNHMVNITIGDTRYAVRIVRRMTLNAGREVYHLESYRESSFLAKAFVSKLSNLNLCDTLKIPTIKLSSSERRAVLNSVIEAALMFSSSEDNPDLADTCEIAYDDQRDTKITSNNLLLYRAKTVDYNELISLAFDILPGVSDLLFLESLSFPVKRALKALNRSANYTFFLSMPYCSLKTSLLNRLSNFATSSTFLCHKITDFSSIDALLLSSQEHYGLNFILDDVGNKGLFRQSSLDKRREDLDTIITFNADRNERSNIILCAEDYQNLGRLSTYSRLLVVSHSKPDPNKMNHMIDVLDQIQAPDVCAFYLDYYNAVQAMTLSEIEELFTHDDYKYKVKANETLRIGRHTHVLYVVWNLLKITLLKGIDSEKYTQSILKHLQNIVNNQQFFEEKLQGMTADPVCLTQKLITSDFLKKYSDVDEFIKTIDCEKACYIDKFKTEAYIRAEVLWSSLRRIYNITCTKNMLNKHLEHAGVIKTPRDGRFVSNIKNKRCLVIDLIALREYASLTSDYIPDINAKQY